MEMFSSVLQVYYKNPLSNDDRAKCQKKIKATQKNQNEDLHTFVYV